MALKDMKRTKADKKERSNLCAVPYEADDYPYSLRVTLDSEELKKLGINSLPKAGAKMSLTAEVSVISVRQSERVKGSPERSMELQITRMELSGKSAGSALDAVQQGIDEAD